MSPRRTAAAPSQSGRTAAAVIAVAIVAIGLTMLARAKPTPTLLDPSSGSPSGARGLVLLLREQGAEVEVTTELDGREAGRVVVLVDRLNPTQRRSLERWVSDGGIAIVADPTSPLLGSPGLEELPGSTGEPSSTDQSDDEDSEPINPNWINGNAVELGTCEIGALAKLERVSLERLDPAAFQSVPDAAQDAVLIPTSGYEQRCFSPGSSEAFVVVDAVGDGLIVGLGENYVLANELLTSGDNAALATALLAPTDGGRVVVLRGTGVPPAVEFGGDQTLLDLIRPGIWMAILTAVIGFVMFALSRTWRVGRPVGEPLPASLPGSELAVATGNLMQRAGHSDRAAELLRFRFHRDLCAANLVPVSASLDELDRVVSSRSTVAPGWILHALSPHQIRDDQQLANFAAEIQRLRQLAIGDPGTRDRATTHSSTIVAVPTGESLPTDQEIR
jgi:hypothetical protein